MLLSVLSKKSLRYLLPTLALLSMNMLHGQNTSIPEKQADSTAKGSFYIHSRLFFMNTQNEGLPKDDYALALGATMGYQSRVYKGFSAKFGMSAVTDLTSSDLNIPDTFTGKLNRYEVGLYDMNKLNDRSLLGRIEEASVLYNCKVFTAQAGRFLLKTPFLNPQDGRMLPTIVEGGRIQLNLNKLHLYAGFINRISPRSTSDWFILKNSFGIYPAGTSYYGGPSKYKNNVHTDGIGYVAVQRKFGQFDVNVWNYYVNNVFNMAFTQIEYKKTLSPKTVLISGIQYTRQDRLGNGGNENQALAYFQQKESNVISARVGAAFNEMSQITFNFTRIMSQGRFLFPREWGIEPFYTFLSRERTEGAADMWAYVLKYSQKVSQVKGLMADVGVGYYKMPSFSNSQMNKYQMPDFAQFNFHLKYNFQKQLKGLEVQYLLVSKLNADTETIPYTIKYNRVNMIQNNIILNYTIHSNKK